MCGIAGFQGTFPQELLGAMDAAMAHRGPDGKGTWRDDASRVAFTHRRLAILDLSHDADQPMLDPQTDNRITYNGEIYNFQALRQELEQKGHSFRTRSDTEVLLKLYAELGPDCVDRLNGIFALAIWDAGKRQMFVARDHYGIKPFYYAETPNGFLFGSELKSVLQSADVDRTLDHRALRDHLTYLYCPWPRTLVKGVRKLPPGSAMIVEDGRITREWRFHTNPYGSTATHRASEAELTEQVREGLHEAVRRQLVSDVPVGAFLSGGLDSSALVAFARRELGESFECFTINDRYGAKDGFASDLPYARKVAKALDVRLNVLEAQPAIADLLPKMMFHLDEPQADFAAVNVMMISQFSREAGIKVLLSGAGGDDLFTGYRRHYAMQQERYWSWLPQPLRAMLSGIGGHLPTHPVQLRRVAKAFQYAGYSAEERLHGYFRWAAPETLNSILNEPADPGLCPSLAETVADCRSDDPLTRMLFLEISHFLTDHNLNYTDKMAMAHGVEVRVPFLDRDLVQLAAGIPNPLRQQGKTGKYILKKAMEGLLPNETIYRAKTGFGVPLREWMQGPLLPLIDDLLSESSTRSRGIFDHAGLQRLRADDAAGRVDGAYTLLGVVCLETWFRTFLDRVPTSPIG